MSKNTESLLPNPAKKGKLLSGKQSLMSFSKGILNYSGCFRITSRLSAENILSGESNTGPLGSFSCYFPSEIH